MTDAASTGGAILVICAAGLARFVPALGAISAIRAFHRDARIVLLTDAATSAFAATAPYADDIWIDDTIETESIGPLLALRRRLQAENFARVYDLDATPHTQRLFWLMYGWYALPFKRAQIFWSGTIPGTALSHADPQRGAMHLFDRWTAQLKIAGIGAVLRPDLSWVARQVQSFTVPFRMTEAFVLMAPAPGPGQPWPADRYGELASLLMGEGQIPVIVGPDVPRDLVTTVLEFCPEAIDLTGRATVSESVFLAWAATAALGPDNGIMHLAAAAGCPTVVLYNGASDPTLVGQRGSRVRILRRPTLVEIPPAEVLAALGLLRK